MTPEPITRQVVNDLASLFSGQNAMLVIPRAYIDLTGDLNAALLLSQIVYWSDRTQNEEGWFAKSYPEWQEELGLSEYQIRRAAKRLETLGVTTKIKKFGGAPTVHYRLNKVTFSEWIMKKLQDRSLSNFRIDPKETSDSLTEITTETTTEVNSAPPPVSEIPPLGNGTSSAKDNFPSLHAYPAVHDRFALSVTPAPLLEAWREAFPKKARPVRTQGDRALAILAEQDGYTAEEVAALTRSKLADGRTQYLFLWAVKDLPQWRLSQAAAIPDREATATPSAPTETPGLAPLPPEERLTAEERARIRAEVMKTS